MTRLSLILSIILVIIFSVADAQRWGRPTWRRPPAPAVRWVQQRVCRPNCQVVRNCTPGGQCAQWGVRHRHVCAQYQWTQQCARYENNEEEVCVSHNGRCAEWQTMNQKYCNRYHQVRTPIMKLVDGECNAFQSRCVQWSQENVTKCVKYGKRCASVSRGNRKLCVQWDSPKPQRRCAEWTTVNDKACKNVTKKCAQFRKCKRRTCLQTASKCARWIKNTKVVQKKICKAKATVCLKHQTYKYSRCTKSVRTGVCAKYGTRNTRVCSQSVRKCLGYATFKKRVCVSAGRKCSRWFKQRLGERCAAWGYRKRSVKRCVEFGKRWVSTVPLQCQKYASKKGYFKYFCKRHQTVVLNGRYCIKREPVIRRVCLSWQGKCNRYETRTGKICNKVGAQCVKYANKRVQFCQVYQQKCVKRATYVGKRCVKHGKKCVQWGTDTCANQHYWTCVNNSKYCSKWGFKWHNICLRWTRVCQGRNPSRRVCKRFVNASRPRRCIRHVNLPTITCNRYEKFCAKAQVGVKKTCLRNARYCTGYKKVYKAVGWNTKTECADWRFRAVNVLCKRYDRYCTQKVRRVTGRRCAQWVNVHVCARNSVVADRYCVRVAPPNCFHTRSCTQSCQIVNVAVRGDVHLQQANGKWINFNKAGIFSYFNVANIKTQIRLKQVKNGSVTSGLAFKVGDKVLKFVPGGVFLNGKRVTEDSVKIGKAKLVKLPGNAGQWGFKTGIHGLKIRVDLEPKFKLISFTIHESQSLLKYKTGGLITPGSEKFAREYTIPKVESYFKTYIPFKDIPIVKPTTADLKKARAECLKFLETGHPSFNQCVQDYVATGINYGPTYLNEKKLDAKKIK